ncbi:hypothetical protein GCM10009860_21230 [Microbacterium mitrae]|uniref:CU044_5270 family protein n=1 Tax=Microbacterium mitrae TaxID=664640 RepID=A0A5C8HLQ1_9MICO|nr:hypothetical protein [Microbacterium mitrae]TXK04175.1 hypothetical protein FVP60_10515 [Microbacterium mitrae]
MNQLDLVRDARKEESTVEPQDLAHARGALNRAMNEAAQTTRAGARRRRMRVGIGGVASVGALAAVAFVATSVFAPPPSTENTAAASEVLQAAADATLTSVTGVDVPLDDGQYLRIETTLDQVMFNQNIANPETAAFGLQRDSVLYVPADRADDWLLETLPGEVTGVYGVGGQEWLEAVQGESQTWMNQATTVAALPGGVEASGQPVETYRDQYDEMPRDPQQLLQWFRDAAPNGYAGFAIVNALWLNLPPADVRAAMLLALAESGEYALVAQEGDLATLERVVDADRAGESRQQFVIDTAQGLIVQMIDSPEYPAVLNLNQTTMTFTLTVVDEAPAPTQ